MAGSVVEVAGVARLRFYAELNDFLPAARRHRDWEYSFDVSPSVKDVIESRGVPHTEVDLILANGEPVDFAYRVADGDRISVYPVFEAFDIEPVGRLRPEPLRDTRFVADVHLGRLTRYLRLLGFDTAYDGTWSDNALAAVSAREHRILLTRDRGLLKRNQVTHGLFVRNDDVTEQAADVVRRLHLHGRVRPFTRCLVCNGALEVAAKDDQADRLLPDTRRHYDDFRRCRGCGRVYWQGAHHARLIGLVDEIGRRAASAPPGTDPG